MIIYSRISEPPAHEASYSLIPGGEVDKSINDFLSNLLIALHRGTPRIRTAHTALGKVGDAIDFANRNGYQVAMLSSASGDNIPSLNGVFYFSRA